MNEPLTIDHELQAEQAFSYQAPVFDELYGKDTIIQYKRQRVRAHIQQYLRSGSSILELNSGTGEDAIWLASQGHSVHATDIAAGMQSVLRQKVETAGVKAVSTELCSFTQLELLKERGPYDMIFSNFAGLNCTGELDKVLASFDTLLKPGGVVTLVLLPEFCLWETMLLFRGRFKTAFRRFFSENGVKAKIDEQEFRCWYYSPRFVRQQLKHKFELLQLEGLCTLVPPSYIQGFAEKHPKKYAWLLKQEDKLRSRWPWRSIGDYYIISMRKRS